MISMFSIRSISMSGPVCEVQCTDLDGGPELRVEQPTQPAVVSAQQSAQRLAGHLLVDRRGGRRGRADCVHRIAGGHQVAVRGDGGRRRLDPGCLVDGVPDYARHVPVRLPGVCNRL